jgi:hypothetical protein
MFALGGSPRAPETRMTHTLFAACRAIAASSPPVTQTTAEAATPNANRSKKVRKSVGMWISEKSVAVISPVRTVPTVSDGIQDEMA